MKLAGQSGPDAQGDYKKTHLSAPRSGPLDLDKGRLEMLQFTDLLQ